MEEKYKIATITLAAVAGVLGILLIITCCCCCCVMKHVRGKCGGNCSECKKARKQNRMSTYESGGQAQPRNTGGCSKCDQGGLGSLSAYDLMGGRGAGMAAPQNPYNMNSSAYTRPTNPEYGRVLLNPPTSACTKPNIASSGNCNTGSGCVYKMTPSAPVSHNQASTGSQFVLESCGNRY